MEPGQDWPLPIRSGNFGKLPINQSSTDGIIDRRNRSNLFVANSDDSPASTDQAVQDSTDKTIQNLTDGALQNSTGQATIAVQLPPIMRIPTEMRAKIFRYLLPDKSQNIEPTYILNARKEFEMELEDEMLERFQQRARAQHRGTNDLLAFSQFYGPFDSEVHNTRFKVPFSVEEFGVPVEFSVEAFGDVYDMPAMSEASSFGDGGGWMGTTTASSPITVSTPSSAKNVPFAGLETMVKRKQTSSSSFWSESTTSDEQQQSNIFIDPPTEKEIIQMKEALQEEQWDALPTNTTVNLMTTHSLFATEISTILYEEYTFEIRVHADGIDFLHLPRIATYEYYGNELANQMAHFQAQGHFCLQRMRHLSFVLVGASIESRTATWRIRKNVEDLVGMVGELASLNVRFSGDDEFWIVDEGEESQRARMGMKAVSVAEMVCAPFSAGLSGVGEVEVALPEGLEEVEGLVEWKGWFEGKIGGSEEVVEDGVREVKEMAMFEATVGWEYRQKVLEGYESFAYLEEMDVDMEGEEDEDEEMGYEDDTN